MSHEETAKVLEAYAAAHDPSYIAADAVFEDVASGNKYVGREAIAAMLHHVYHVAFEATAELKKTTVGDGNAVLEVDFVGRHIGEFAGVEPTGRDVRVPLVVSYDIADGLIQNARIYFMASIFFQQVGGGKG